MDELRYLSSHTRQARVRRLRKLHSDNIVSYLCHHALLYGIGHRVRQEYWYRYLAIRSWSGRYFAAGHEHPVCHLHHSCYKVKLAATPPSSVDQNLHPFSPSFNLSNARQSLWKDRMPTIAQPQWGTSHVKEAALLTLSLILTIGIT